MFIYNILLMYLQIYVHVVLVSVNDTYVLYNLTLFDLCLSITYYWCAISNSKMQNCHKLDFLNSTVD